MTTVLDPSPSGGVPASTRSWRLFYVAIVVVGAVASCAFLGRNSLYLDETTTTTLARTSWHRFAGLVVHRETNMSLYYLLMRGWSELGRSEVAVRSLSVLASIGALTVLVVLARDLFGRRAALIGGVLLAVDPLWIEFSQDARGYALSLLLVSASSALFVRGVQRNSTWWTWAGYAVMSALAAYANFWAALVPIAQLCSLGFLPRERIPWRQVVPAVVGLVVLLGPLAVMIHGDAGAGAGATAVTAGRVFTIVRSNVPHIVIDLGVVGVVVAVVGFALLLKRGRAATVLARWPLMFTLCWFAVPIVVMVLASFAYKPLVNIRYLVVCFPPVAILAGAGLARIRLRLRVVGMAVLIATSGVGLWNWYAHGWGTDWRDATAAVADRSSPGDGVMIFVPYMRIPFEWYLADHPVGEQNLRAVYPELGWGIDPMRFDSYIPVSSAEVVHASQRFSRIWLVQSGAQVQPQSEQNMLAGLRSAGFAPRRSLSFAGIQVTEYGTTAPVSGH